jgi:hypothetical protein
MKERRTENVCGGGKVRRGGKPKEGKEGAEERTEEGE